MRLAYCVRAVFPHHGYGGLERSSSALLKHLVAQGADVTLFTRPLPVGMPFFMLPSRLGGRLMVRTARYGRLPLRANGIPARLTNYRVFVEDMGRRIRAMAYKGQLDGIYAHGLCAWGVRHAAEWGVPLVVNPHGMEEFKVRDPLKRLAYAPFRAWVRAACRAADRVIATDYAMLGEVSRLLRVRTEKVVVIPNGVDIAEARAYINPGVQAALTQRWPALVSSGVLRGISVGRLEENKGFEFLLEALDMARAALGNSWQWVIVGEGSLRGRLEDVAAERDLGEHVSFAGGLSDAELHNLYGMSDLFAHPTLYEGSSLVTLEAMAHGLPVVASAVGGIPDKVVDGATGFLVQPGQPEQLASKLAWLATHPNERTMMGRAGAKLVAEKFGWELIAAQTLELFSRLRDEKGACRVEEEAVRPC
ncbi:MAG TPA: glycosyltransferase family 4 protein [Chloroflexia bacterium]|nr:glycosyltransferase family 4 protein [Chloroflexia bacterium]